MDALSAHELVDGYFRLYYRKPLAAMEITETRGYWQSKEPCDPATCQSAAVHGAFGWEGPIKHTYRFVEPGVRHADGRFDSPYRAWRALYDAVHGDPPARISRDAMGFGCPICGALFDRMERSVVERERFRRRDEIVIRVDKSPTFAFCTGGHKFLIDPNVVRA